MLSASYVVPRGYILILVYSIIMAKKSIRNRASSRSRKNRSLRRNARKTQLKRKNRNQRNKKTNKNKQNKQNKQKRRRRTLKGGANPFSEVSSFPSVFGGQIQNMANTVVGDHTPETTQVSSLSTDQPHLSSGEGVRVDTGPDLQGAY